MLSQRFFGILNEFQLISLWGNASGELSLDFSSEIGQLRLENQIAQNFERHPCVEGEEKALKESSLRFLRPLNKSQSTSF